MENETYEVRGTFRITREWKPYTKVVQAANERLAVERTLCTIGSEHRLKRNYITVDAVTVVHGE
ncbi:MAG: 50S ribosomal protein L18a [Methanomicrobiaceae archaeon]|uniref:Lsu ribosomal protein l18ae n=1 Tax=hydrocarbon metagenome TaxID=938273 RepID=A0A0W8FJU5_9ZZZZ|nr:50S ribosomal protein L18a [Methanomicrobiaceae archaeon]MDD5419831.1 50S ribosomal protein L18Ae [Methanomicrobiaceae archaeon]